MDSTIELKNVITSDSSQFQEDLGNASQSVNDLGSAQDNTSQKGQGFGEVLLNIGEIAGGIALEKLTESVVGLGDALVSVGIGGSASLENVKVAFDSAFGGGASQMLGSLNKISEAMPVTNDQLDKMALKMQNMGVPTKQISGDLQDIADIASGTGTSFQEMGSIMDSTSSVLATAFARGSVSSLQLRSIANQGIPIYQAVVDQLNYSGAAADAMGKANEKAGAKSEAAGVQHKALAEKIDLATKSLKILEAEHVKAGDATDKHNLAVEKAKESLATLQSQFDKTGSAMANTGQKTKITVADLIAGGKSVQISASQFQAALAGLSEGKYADDAKKQANTFNGTMKNLSQSFQETIMNMVGVNQSTGAITKGGIFDTLKTNASQLLDYINAHKDEISNAFKQIVDEVIKNLPTIKQILDAVKEAIDYLIAHKGDFQTIAFWLGAILNFPTNLVNSWKAVGAWWSAFWQGLGNTVFGVFASIRDGIKSFMNSIISSFDSVITGVNNLSGKIPGIGKAVSIPLIPHLAGGTDFFAGGMALVGEQGPELVNLPQGSSVASNSQTKNMMSSPTININNPVVRSDQDIQSIITQVKQALGRQTELAKLGAL